MFFQILKRDQGEVPCHSGFEERIGVQLEQQRQTKILERLEFEKQTELFNQKELVKALQRKEILRANQDAWVDQIKMNQAKELSDKIIEESGGTQATFLTRMFKHQEREVK